MKTKAKKAAAPQLDLDATSAAPAPTPAASNEPKDEPKTYRTAALGTGRRSLFRDKTEAELAAG